MRPSHLAATATLFAAPLVFAGFADAATWYKVGSGGADRWHDPATWWSNPDGSGTNPDADLSTWADDLWVSQSEQIRTNDGSNGGVFAGQSVQLDGGRFGLKANSGSAGTVDSVVVTSTGGGISNSEYTNPSFTLNDVQLNGDLAITGLSFVLNVGTLTGSGDIIADPATFQDVTLKLAITDATGYTGDISLIEDQVLDFDTDLATAGSLTLPGDSASDARQRQLILDQDLTFASATIAGDVLAPGTYTYDELVAEYGSLFSTSGNEGSITVGVIPEPASLGLIGLGGCLVLGRRKRS